MLPWVQRFGREGGSQGAAGEGPAAGNQLKQRSGGQGSSEMGNKEGEMTVLGFLCHLEKKKEGMSFEQYNTAQGCENRGLSELG